MTRGTAVRAVRLISRDRNCDHWNSGDQRFLHAVEAAVRHENVAVRKKQRLWDVRLEAWEREQTETVIEQLQLIRDPRERLRAVMEAAVTDREGGIRDAAFLSAAHHPLVRPVVARVTARRLGYMADSFAELSDGRLETYADELVSTLIPAAKAPK